MAGVQFAGTLHQEVALPIVPVGVGQHLKSAEGVAHGDLHRIKQGDAVTRLLGCGGQQGSHFAGLGQQLGEIVLEARALQHIGGEVSVIEPPRLLQDLVQLQPPVAIGPLGIDAAKEQRQQGAQYHVGTAPQRRLYIPRHGPHGDSQGDADQQPHIGALAEGQIAAEEHDAPAPDQGEWQGVDLEIKRHHPATGAEDGAHHPLQGAGEHIAPKRDGAHHHHQGDQRPGALRQFQLAGQQKGEHKGERNAQAMDDPVAAIDQQIESGEGGIKTHGLPPVRWVTGRRASGRRPVGI